MLGSNLHLKLSCLHAFSISLAVGPSHAWKWVSDENKQETPQALQSFSLPPRFCEHQDKGGTPWSSGIHLQFGQTFSSPAEQANDLNQLSFSTDTQNWTAQLPVVKGPGLLRKSPFTVVVEYTLFHTAKLELSNDASLVRFSSDWSAMRVYLFVCDSRVWFIRLKDTHFRYAGHSHFANIKHKKERKDALKGSELGKISGAIRSASKCAHQLYFLFYLKLQWVGLTQSQTQLLRPKYRRQKHWDFQKIELKMLFYLFENPSQFCFLPYRDKVFSQGPQKKWSWKRRDPETFLCWSSLLRTIKIGDKLFRNFKSLWN